MANRPTQCKYSESECSETRIHSMRILVAVYKAINRSSSLIRRSLSNHLYHGDAVIEMIAEARDQNRYITIFITRPLIFLVLAPTKWLLTNYANTL